MKSPLDHRSLNMQRKGRIGKFVASVWTCCVAFGLLTSGGCGAGDGQSSEDAGTRAAESPACRVKGLLPDPVCTPGAAQTSDLGVICGTSTSVRRQVSEETRQRAFAEYGVALHNPPGTYELDHLIPLEIGGSNDIANLWPEAAPGFRRKDEVEDFLHDSVCSGRMGVSDAQRAIASDWTRVVVK